MTHSDSCGCGHNHEHNGDKCKTDKDILKTLSDAQKEFLHRVNHHSCLPVARFTVIDSRNEDFISTALAPVFLTSVNDDMETVKQAGAFLQNLENMGLLTIDYDIPLNEYPYKEYKESKLYQFFCETVAEGAAKPGFLGDTAVLELGSMALTEEGEKIACAYCSNIQHE